MKVKDANVAKKECQGFKIACGGEVIYRVFYKPDMSVVAGGWLCRLCAQTMKDSGMIVIDKRNGL